MQNPRLRTAIMIVATTAMLLAGCGDDGDGGTTDTTIASQPGDSNGGSSRAATAVLHVEDLTDGFAEQPAEEAPDHETTWQDLVTCLGLQPAAEGADIATSPSFVRGMGMTVGATVEYRASESEVDDLVAAFESDGFDACAQAALTADKERNVPDGLSISGIQAAPLDFAAGKGTTVAYRATGTLNVGFEVFTDFVVVLDGRSISRFGFINPSAPFDVAAQQDIVDKVTTRV